MGIRTGDIAVGMDDATPRKQDAEGWTARLVYDLLFFILIGVLLFDMVTGIILDSFGSLREEAAERTKQIHEECLVCGLTDPDFADLPPSFDFESHVHNEHKIWNYVYFFAYLSRKDPTEFNGSEQYIAHMLEAGDVSFFPGKTSWHIEKYQREKDAVAAEMAHSQNQVFRKEDDSSSSDSSSDDDEEKKKQKKKEKSKNASRRRRTQRRHRRRRGR